MQLRSTAGDLDEASFLSEFAYADDLAFTSLSLARGQDQLHSFQRVAEQCNLHLNPKKGKSEVHTTSSDNIIVYELHGSPLATVSTYKYLGTRPMNSVQAFAERKRLAWAVIKRFDTLWFCSRITRDTKRYFFQVFVMPTLMYGSALWPCTRAFARELDSAVSRMLKYTLGPCNNMQLAYLNGSIPLPSSSMDYNRIMLLGHALRHDQLVGDIIYASGPLAHSLGRHLTLEKWYRTHIPFDVDAWWETSKNRDLWRSMARSIAFQTEDLQYSRYFKTCHDRWASRSSTIQCLNHLSGWTDHIRSTDFRFREYF